MCGQQKVDDYMVSLGYSGKRKCVFPRGKNAQVTIFMIIGIVLLFSSAIIFYIRGEVAEEERENLAIFKQLLP